MNNFIKLRVSKVLTNTAVMFVPLLLVACGQTADTSSAVEVVDTVVEPVVLPVITGPLVSSSDEITVFKGDTFTLDIQMSDFESVSEGGGINVQFDSTLLQAVNVDIDGSIWKFKNMDGTINNSAGTISDILFSSYQGVEGDTTIASIEFQSIDSGVSSIVLSESSKNLFASNGERVLVSFKSTTVLSN